MVRLRQLLRDCGAHCGGCFAGLLPQEHLSSSNDAPSWFSSLLRRRPPENLSVYDLQTRRYLKDQVVTLDEKLRDLEGEGSCNGKEGPPTSEILETRLKLRQYHNLALRYEGNSATTEGPSSA